MGTRVQGSHDCDGHVSLPRVVCIVVHRVESRPLYAPLLTTSYTLPHRPSTIIGDVICALSVESLIAMLIPVRARNALARWSTSMNYNIWRNG